MTENKKRRFFTLQPVIMGRWVLLAKYALLAFLGFTAFYRGAPSLDFATPDGYRPIWAVFIVLSGLLSFAACITGRDKFERWTCLVLICFMGAYIYAVIIAALGGDEDKSTVAVAVTAILILPAGRWVSLLPKGTRQ